MLHREAKHVCGAGSAGLRATDKEILVSVGRMLATQHEVRVAVSCHTA
ncbi:MAG: hypothetical protein U0R19_39275 [Bryobacteraceae bacterium]